MKLSNKVNLKLMEAMSFNEKDLAMNRQLKLSEKQKHKLRPIISVNVALSIICATICFFITSFALFKGFESVSLFLLTLFGVFGFGLSFYWAFRSIQNENQLKKYSGVKFVEGKAVFNISYKRNNLNPTEKMDIPIYSMKIKNIKIYLDEETYDSIVGSEFRVYYFQNYKKYILSIEKLE